MQEVFKIKLDSDIIPLISKRKHDAVRRLKEMVIIELFREGKISTGKAAQILEINRVDFISLLSNLQIPYFTQDKQELLKEISNA